MQRRHPITIRMLCNIFLRSRIPLLEKEGNMPLPLRVTSIPRNIFFLIVGFLLMLASAAAGQVLKTAKPAEQVERHLASDQKLREWSLDENVPDDIKRIKVCRAEEVCSMRFREGETPRMRIRNLVVPLRYEDENISISESFTRQVRQALDNLQDKPGVTVRFIGYTDDAPLTGR